VTAQALTLPAPAKLNLGLNIIGQRDDGYHLLQSLFQLVDTCDYIKLSHSPTIEFSCNDESLNNPDNLVVRAAKLLKSHTGYNGGASIYLDKRLPYGGGLGSGSSDAATTLVGLNTLWNTGLDRGELAQLGLSLGADIPVFVMGQSAWVEGIGEQITPTQIPQKHFVVVAPNCHVSTVKIFTHKGLTRDSSIIKVRLALEGQANNDCEALVRELYPEVDRAMNWLSQYQPAHLTGTGSCIYAEFPTLEDARAIVDMLPAELSGIVCSGCNTSPLYRAIEEQTTGV